MSHDKTPVGKSAQVKWGACLFPYLLAIWFCLVFLQADAKSIPPLWMLIKTIGFVLLSVGLVHAVLLVLIRKSPARELILLQVVGAVGIYGSYSSLLIPVVGNLAFHLTYLLGNFGIAYLLYKHHEHRITDAISGMGLLGITLALVLMTVGIGRPVLNDTHQIDDLVFELSVANPLNEHPPEVRTEQLPDIYYVIVDAYAREDVLQQVYGFDNQNFTNSLRERGFFVGDESRSNYHLTEMSLASSMNMTHLHELDLKRFKTRMPIRQMIQNSNVVGFLKQLGYETVAFETGKADTQCQNFDRYVSFGYALDDYQDVLYHRSLMPVLLDWTGFSKLSAASRHASRTIETLESIPTAVQPDAKPTFVFSHMLAPHPPFVFDSNGDEVDLHGYYLLADGFHFTACHDFDTEIYRKAYCEQLTFINKKLIEMIDQIQRSDRPSIIIVQGDHGPRLGFGSIELMSDTEEVSPIREGFSILNAICVPQQWQPEFYASMTPVNTFRLILNEVFGTSLPLEADESWLEDHYKFTNATSEAMPLVTANSDSNDRKSEAQDGLPTLSATPVSLKIRHSESQSPKHDQGAKP